MKTGSMLGTAPEPLELIVRRRMLHKLLNIKDNTAHPLNISEVITTDYY